MTTIGSHGRARTSATPAFTGAGCLVTGFFAVVVFVGIPLVLITTGSPAGRNVGIGWFATYVLVVVVAVIVNMPRRSPKPYLPPAPAPAEPVMPDLRQSPTADAVRRGARG